MKASIDAVREVLPADDVDVMKLSLSDTIADIAANTPRALALGEASKPSLTRLAQVRYDWQSVARNFLRVVESKHAS